MNKSVGRQPASQSMSLCGWQQVPSPRYIGESMVAGSANCALGSSANSASLAVSVCQCHLGRTAMCTYLFPTQRAQTHIHTCVVAHKKARVDIHSTYIQHAQICMVWILHTHIKARTHAHTHAHSRTLTAHHLCAASDFSLCYVLCPCFCFHKLSVPRLLSTHSLTMSHLIGWVSEPRIPALCHGHLCIDT